MLLQARTGSDKEAFWIPLQSENWSDPKAPRILSGVLLLKQSSAKGICNLLLVDTDGSSEADLAKDDVIDLRTKEMK